MPNATVDATLALDIEATRVSAGAVGPMVQEAQRTRAASNPKPAEVPAAGLDPIALYRRDEVEAAWSLVYQAEADAKEAMDLARAAIAILRQNAIAIGQSADEDRMRLRHTSYTYDYDFARAVLGDSALPPRPKQPTPKAERWDPFAALAQEDE